jgi:hypothetical protein
VTDTARKMALYAARKSGERPLRTPVEKSCNGCGEVKPAAGFRRSFHNDSGLDARCHECVSEANRLRLFGVTPEQHRVMLEQQGGGCAICGGAELALANHGRGIRGLAVDHDHTTGAVRGLLCSNCNKALGCMQDDPDRLLAAAMYLLQSHSLLGVVS